MIYTLDHEPAHVHVTGAGQAKIDLLGRDGMPEVVYSVGIGRPALRRIIAAVIERRSVFLQEWEHIHGRRD